MLVQHPHSAGAIFNRICDDPGSHRDREKPRSARWRRCVDDDALDDARAFDRPPLAPTPPIEEELESYSRTTCLMHPSCFRSWRSAITRSTARDARSSHRVRGSLARGRRIFLSVGRRLVVTEMKGETRSGARLRDHSQDSTIEEALAQQLNEVRGHCWACLTTGVLGPKASWDQCPRIVIAQRERYRVGRTVQEGTRRECAALEEAKAGWPVSTVGEPSLVARTEV